jgi:hypothetical protein
MSIVTATEVEAAVRGLCIAQMTNIGIDISMPVILPDGDFVNVTVVEDGDAFLVHDGSSAVMSLAAVGAKTGADARKKFLPMITRFGCDMSGDRIQRRVSREHVGVAAVMVSNAARSIADTALEFRRRSEFDFRKAVSEKVADAVGKRARFNQEVKGQSGRVYHVQNVILDSLEKRPIAFLESVANRTAVAGHFTEFFDIKSANDMIVYASVYDDTSDLRDVDTRLLSNVSRVISYSGSAIEIAALAAAA